MLLSCLPDNLRNAITTVAPASKGVSTMPITSSVLLRAEHGQLDLAATNLTVRAETSTGAMIEKEGAVALPIDTLSKLLRTLPSDRLDIKVDTTTNIAELTCGRSVATIAGYPAADFPEVFKGFSEEDIVTFSIAPDKLAEAVDLVAFSASDNDNRPILRGIYIKLGDGQMTMATADGFRLSESVQTMTEDDARLPETEVAFTVPAEVMRDVSKRCRNAVKMVKVTATKSENEWRLVQFDFGDGTRFSVQLLLGLFPNYQSLIPDRFTSRVVMGRQSLARSIDSGMIFLEEGVPLRLIVHSPQDANTVEGNMKVICRNMQDGAGGYSEDIAPEVDVDGPSIRVAVSAKYLRDCLRALKQFDDVALLMVANDEETSGAILTGSTSPIVIEPATQPTGQLFRHTVMPMYTAWEDTDV